MCVTTMNRNIRHLEEIRASVLTEIRSRSRRKEGTEELDLRLQHVDGALNILRQLSMKYVLVEREHMRRIRRHARQSAELARSIVALDTGTEE